MACQLSEQRSYLGTVRPAALSGVVGGAAATLC
jgi:hypothetical protein